MLDVSETTVGHRETPDALTVGELMSTDVHVARMGDTLEEAHKFMRMAGVRHLPVMNADDEMIGILSDRDLLLGWSQGPATAVSELMTRYTKWVHPQTTARDAAAMILADRIGCLPVLDDKRRLIGIVTETDFLLVAHRALTMLQMLAA
jgi:CBS domain-containing membrane protein